MHAISREPAHEQRQRQRERDDDDDETSQGVVTVRLPHGVSATAARVLVRVARTFCADVVLMVCDDHGRTSQANARALLDVLLLEARRGDAVVVRCVGPEASAAYAAVVSILLAEGAVDA